MIVPVYQNDDPAHPHPDSIWTDGVSIHPLPHVDGNGESVNNGVIVKVNPPKIPFNEKTRLSHVPCDIALVIDVSGSMDEEAPMPYDPDNDDADEVMDDVGNENTALSVLDLVKHACRTILSTMDERDRLAIIKYSSKAAVLQGLTSTTDENKNQAMINIENLQTEGSTNLWHAIKAGIKVFRDADQVGNVPAIMILTDGKPNHMCPNEGYVPALQKMGTIAPSIHTYGFGYRLRSGLLKSIAEFGGGNYAFIPDAGMIGTTFIHAVAHLQSTVAINAKLCLKYGDNVHVEETMGSYVKQQLEPDLRREKHGSTIRHLMIPLGNLQYGQSRDIYLKWLHHKYLFSDSRPPILSATLRYDVPATNSVVTHLERKSACNLLTEPSTSLTEAEIAYHISRSQICAFIAGLFPIDGLGEHRMVAELKARYGGDGSTTSPGLEAKQQELNELLASLPAGNYPDDPRCQSLLQDLNGAAPFGQVAMALSSSANFARWGQHYLPSLHGAHVRQLCNNFKDPGPLQYNTESPLFIKCRDELDIIFNELPSPEPSLIMDENSGRFYSNASTLQAAYSRAGISHHVHQLSLDRRHRNTNPPPPGSSAQDANNDAIDDPLYRIRGGPVSQSSKYSSGSFSMVRYNLSSNPCFAGDTLVELGHGGGKIPIKDLKTGMQVATPMGPRDVVAVLVTPVEKEWMVELEGVLVTPWHPVTLSVCTDNVSTGWQFPCNLVKSARNMVEYTGWIYSVLLQQDANADAHALLLGDTAPFWGVTLGHGLVSGSGSDVRAHGFFGDYTHIVKSLVGLGVRDDDGCLLTGGVARSKTTGLVCGFKKHRGPWANGPSFPCGNKTTGLNQQAQNAVNQAFMKTSY